MAATVNPAALQLRPNPPDDNPRLPKRQRTDDLSHLCPPSTLQPQPQSQSHNSTSRQVIDLTNSPSPPPPPPQPAPVPNYPQQYHVPGLPAELPPRTPICIGQLSVTALVLYPVPYLNVTDPRMPHSEWAPVKLQYERVHDGQEVQDTVRIRLPSSRGPNGDEILSEAFGVVEQKVATSLGRMLGKGLIRIDANVRRGMPNVPILSLQMLVYTPKGNVPIVGNYLQQCNLLLDHPTPPFDLARLSATYHYLNPHNPPAGGFNRGLVLPRPSLSPGYSPWSASAANAKSVEVQRTHVDEFFQSLKSGDELAETDCGFNVATPLYSHQKKALTFLLEREREVPGADGKFSSLWQPRMNPLSRTTSWYHLVTQTEVFKEPFEGKGSILADDMGLGKTITCVALIASTISAAAHFASTPPESPVPPSEAASDDPSPSHFAGSVFGMPEHTNSRQKENTAKQRNKLESDFARRSRIKTKSRASLVVCPLSTISNWEDQFKEHWNGPVTVVGGSGGFCPPPASAGTSLISLDDGAIDAKPPPPERLQDSASLRVYIYHGNARRPDPHFLSDFDVVITTYSTLASEFSRQSKSSQTPENDLADEDAASSDGLGGVDIDEQGNPTLRLPKAKNPLKRKKSAPVLNGIAVSSPLQAVHWFRVVLDEAHCIKETSTVGSRASCELMADRRLCLTGTPVQNKLDDVFALIKFLRLEPLSDKAVWTEFIGSPVKFGQALGVVRLQTIMKCITLRRTKETKTRDGKRILDLPPRFDEIRYLDFNEREKEIYGRFFAESKAEFNDLSNKNEVMKNYVGILQKILRLRQICDHYELVDGKDKPQYTFDNLSSLIAREGINVERANAIFSIFRESATTQCVECGSELCASGDNGSLDTAEMEATAGPSGTPKRGRKSVKGSTSSRAPTRAGTPVSSHIVVTRCQHLFCRECYRGSIFPCWPDVPPNTCHPCSACQYTLSPLDAVEIKDCPPELPTKKVSRREKRERGLTVETINLSTKIKVLMEDLLQSSRANPYSRNYDPSSIEVQMVDKNGNEIKDGGVKTVVFSQWTTMLDKIEDALELANIRYDRLDGTMKRDDRTRAMDALKHDPACEVLLVSLKAGGVGLNLTAAQRVYLMDPYWNPAVENQAVDRIHRLGQQKPVNTIKLIIRQSIEYRLLEVQEKKTALANMTLGQNFTKAQLMQRRIEDLSTLFSG